MEVPSLKENIDLLMLRIRYGIDGKKINQAASATFGMLYSLICNEYNTTNASFFYLDTSQNEIQIDSQDSLLKL